MKANKIKRIRLVGLALSCYAFLQPLGFGGPTDRPIEKAPYGKPKQGITHLKSKIQNHKIEQAPGSKREGGHPAAAKTTTRPSGLDHLRQGQDGLDHSGVKSTGKSPNLGRTLSAESAHQPGANTASLGRERLPEKTEKPAGLPSESAHAGLPVDRSFNAVRRPTPQAATLGGVAKASTSSTGAISGTGLKRRF